MSLGFVMLAHTALDRAAQVALHWARAGKALVIHVDRRVGDAEFQALQSELSEFDRVKWAPRQTCEWGQWSIVDATQTAVAQMLDGFPDVTRVFLTSGSCLPLRSIEGLDSYLDDHPSVDFIESVTTDDVDWTIGGLAQERFTLRFPFSWKRQRGLFDRYVALQRKLKMSRAVPERIVPHLGSQWWCLTRPTLTAILDDPERPSLERYFRKVWIPDESYFQTLTRLHSQNIESRSLTLTKFDFQGKPHVFYDDHIPLLRRSNCFVARKAWPQSDKLYSEFLDRPSQTPPDVAPDPLLIDRIFTRANERRVRGRTGLFMISRYPQSVWTDAKTARRYFVYSGFDHVFAGFEAWLAKRTGADVHGHLFATESAEFAGRGEIFRGGLSCNPKLRDYRPQNFLRNLVWSARGEDQCFMFSPADRQKITSFLVSDRNAHVTIISGAWAIPLLTSKEPFSKVRKEAARLQYVEQQFINLARSVQSSARVRIWSLSEFISDPVVNLQEVLDEIGVTSSHKLQELPKMADLNEFGAFLQRLKNGGMSPYLMGNFSTRRSEPEPMSFLAKSSDG